MVAAAVEQGVSFERVLHALEGRGCTVQRRGWQASAQCPAHEDRTPSLSVTWRDGKTLLHCFNGCTDAGVRNDPRPVLDALGLTGGDLFDEPLPPPGPARPRRGQPRRAAAGTSGQAPRPTVAPRVKKTSKRDKLGRPTGPWEVVAEYVYTDEDGAPRGKVARKQQTCERGYDKTFLHFHWRDQCKPDQGPHKHDADGWGPGAPKDPVLYCLPWVLAAAAAGHEVWLVEGEKDADALNDHFRQAGSGVVATTYASGAGSWKDDYAAALTGAHLVIVEDNDAEGTHPITGAPLEPAGRRRTRKLRAALDDPAASIRVVRAKTGKDSYDHLAAGHTAEDFQPVEAPPQDGRAGLRLVTSQDGRGGDGGGGGTGGGEDDGEFPNRRVRYLIRQGELVKATTSRQGDITYDVVLGCTAQMLRVDQKVTTGDETPVTTGYLIGVEHTARPGEGRKIQVPRKSWDSGEWLHDLPWPGVTFDSSRNGMSKIRDAIRMTSPAADVTTVHGAPGWVRGEDGGWMFIHAGGALGAAGPVPAEADLPAKLAHFVLPQPPADPAALRAAAAHSTGLVNALPARIGAVLAGLAYRAAISRMPPPVTLMGPPASYKTSMGKVALHHFAPDLPFDESVLSLSERGATGNAAARLMHLTRDTLLLADDAAPDRSLKAAAERVASIIRLQYNGESRDRLDREAELRRPDPPRGSLLISAEVGPSAASASQRTLIVPFHPGEITRDARIALWEDESRRGRAAALASFICWQAGQREQILARVAALTGEYAQDWSDAGYDERTAEALAHLAAGWRLFLDHLTERSGCTTAEAQQLWEQAWDGLAVAGRLQNDPDEPADPAGRILARLRTGLIGRFAHLSDEHGMPPPVADAPRYGWVVEPANARGGMSPGLDTAPPLVRSSGADLVGCYADENGERRLWLVPELTLMMLRRVADRLGEPFEETVSSVGEWLRQSGIGLITTQEKATGRLRRSCQHTLPGGRRLWVWDIPESALYGGGQDPRPSGGPGGAPGPGDDSDPDTGPGEPAGNDGGARQDELNELDQAATSGRRGAAAPADHEPGEEVSVDRPAAPAPEPTWPGLFSYPQLLDLADQEGVPAKDPAGLRRHYCAVSEVASADAQPCAGCGGRSIVFVGQVPLHLRCPDPPSGWRPSGPPPAPAEPMPARPGPDQPAAASPGPKPAAHTSAAAARPARPAPGGAATTEHRWRAAAAVLTAEGIYLPDGEIMPLPADLAHAGDLAGLPLHLDLGWGGGKLPPATGQLWLTADFLDRAGLPLPAPGISVEDTEALLEQGAAAPFITAAVGGGWEISEASRSRLGHRMRIWRGSNKAGAQLVFMPYITTDVPLLAGDPGPATLAARLDLFARTVHVPFGRSAAYTGHDLLRQLDVRRKMVVEGPVRPPPVKPSASGLIGDQRAPTEDEAKSRYLHSYDTTAAWLAAAAGTELGIGAAVHADAPRFDPAVPGLWRVTPPRWDTWAVPDPFAARRLLEDGTAWLPTPLLALAADPAMLAAELRPAEAWIWPEHTRYLSLWAGELNKARLALAGSPPGDLDVLAVFNTVKDTYSGAITLFGSRQLDEQIADNGEILRPQDKFFRPDWAWFVVFTALARLYRKILQVEAANPGLWPVAIDRDNLLYPSNDPDPERACPAPLRYGNQLGGVKSKGSALMADAAAKLAAGRFAFDTDLIPADRWDRHRGGPAAETS